MDQNCGSLPFRRFRTLGVRRQHAPKDLIRFCLGHANQSVTDGYCKLKSDVTFPTNVKDQEGIGLQFLDRENPRC